MNALRRLMVLVALLTLSLGTVRADFLFEQGEDKSNSLYGDNTRRGVKVHDLITIQVDDRTISSVKGALTTDRSTEWQDIIKNFIKISTKDGLKFKDAMRQTTNPEIDVESTMKTDKKASTDRTTRITYTITAEVKQVLPNGNLILEARTVKQVGEEQEKVTLTGVARAEDIDANNMIRAERLANLGLKVEGDGPVGDHQQRGWLARILDKLWPF